MGRVPRIMLLSCAMVAVFVWLQACDQAGSPVEMQEKEHSVEQPKPREADSSPDPRRTPEPTTSASATVSTSASARTFSMPTEDQAAQSEATCRLANYVANENLTVQQASALSERVAERTGRTMQADSSLGAGRAKNAALDDLGVPRYPECKMGVE